MTAISKNVHFDVLNDIVNKYNNAVHRSIKMTPIHVTSESDAEYKIDSNDKDPKLKVGDQVMISKYKKILLKNTHKIDLKKFLLLAKLKIQFRGLIVLLP